MFVDDQFITYSSPPHKRKLGRSMAVGAAAMLVVILFSIASNYKTRKAAGYDPLPASSLVIPVAPLMLLGIGLWIGWGQTRIDLRRGVVERRPLGLPWLAKIVRLKDAKRLYVGLYRAPTMISTPNAAVVFKGTNKGMPFWFVRLEGEKVRTMLMVQRSYEDAVEFAQEIGERVGLAVDVEARPEE